MGWPTKEAEQEYNRKRYLANKEEYKARALEWSLANPERRKEIVAKNQSKSLVQRNINQKKREALKKKATPPWLTEVDIVCMDYLYKLAKSFDEPLEVDHIIPLQGKLVCGLHVPSNLQILTKVENRMKHNKFEVA